jgi:hypothetical protein
MDNNAKAPMADSPIVCTLGPEALKARKEGLLTRVARLSRHVVKLPTGFRLEFAAEGDTLRALTDLIDAERQCCRFFRFALTVEPDGGPMQLEVTGPVGTADLIDALLDTR